MDFKKFAIDNARAQALSSVERTQPVTVEEGRVIASLLSLYEAAWAEANHRKGCECQFCHALEAAGEHSYKLFDSLEEKFQAAVPLDAEKP